MRAILETTRALIRRLCQPWSVHGPRLTSEQEVQQIQQDIRLIGEAHEPAAVPTLVIYLYSGSSEISAAAAKGIHQIVEQCGPLDLAQLNGIVREVGDWRAPPLNASDVLALSRGLTGTLGVLSFHGSGYVREAAVRSLAETEDGKELAFLLIRLND